MEELIGIDAIGKTFAERYGRVFIKTIKEYKKPSLPYEKAGNGLHTDVDKIIGMIKSGTPITDIASEKRMSLPELANLLESEINSGLIIDPSGLIEKNKFSQILKLVRSNRRASLRQIRAAIEWEIDFPLLRILVAIARNSLK
jgi:uncharacterized protein YpbB